MIALFCFALANVYAECLECHYVRQGADGKNDGTDWSNAWNDTTAIDWGIIHPGSTVYISGGEYSTLNVGAGGIPGKPIVVRLATHERHGSSEGWRPDYAGDAVFIGPNHIRISESIEHVIIDGSYDYGFRVLLPYRRCNSAGIVLNGNHNMVKHVHIDGNDDDWASIGIRLNHNNNSIISVLIKDTPNDAIRVVGTNHLIERSAILPYAASRVANTCCSGNVCHADGLEISATSNITVRYNWFSWPGDTMIFGINGGTSENWKIYGNVFHNGGTAMKIQSRDRPQLNIMVYNNAFVNYGGFVLRTQKFDFRNNLFFNARGFDTGSNLIEENDPFIDQFSGDFRLISTSRAIDAGEALPEEYSVDPAGNVRGADGFWDIGAYEHVQDDPGVGENQPPIRALGAPSGHLDAGTAETSVSLATNEPANCRYSTAPGT